jgi:putative FmdB family regulatory protein
MPNYDYICEKCDNAISRVVQFKDRCGAQRCPECSGRALYQFKVMERTLKKRHVVLDNKAIKE